MKKNPKTVVAFGGWRIDDIKAEIPWFPLTQINVVDEDGDPQAVNHAILNQAVQLNRIEAEAGSPQKNNPVQAVIAWNGLAPKPCDLTLHFAEKA